MENTSSPETLDDVDYMPYRRRYKQEGDWQGALKAAATAARQGAESTINLVPRRGRGSFLGERARGHKDAGAEAVALIFTALTDVLSV